MVTALTPNNSDISLRDIDEMIRQRGDFITWYRGLLCSCGGRNGDANRSRLSCAACGGFGYVYHDGVEFRAIVVGVETQPKLLLAGLADPGDCILITPPRIVEQPSDWDMITFSNFTFGDPNYGEVIQRGAVNEVDPLMFTALEMQDVASVNYLTGAVNFYEQGVHYTVSGKTLSWIPLSINPIPPITGSNYSVKYRALYEWVVFTSPSINFERNTHLGSHCVLKRRDTVGTSLPVETA